MQQILIRVTNLGLTPGKPGMSILSPDSATPLSSAPVACDFAMIPDALRRSVLLLSLALVTIGPAFAAPPGGPEIAGWTETARLLPSGLELPAKLDTGAENSSLHVERQRYFRRGGERWVRFTVEAGGRRVGFERRVLRKAAIKRHDEDSHVRPVVAMVICLGSKAHEVEVNLVDRSRFDYPLLIGRSFLAGEFLVDTAASNLQPLDCPEKPTQ